MKKSIFVYLLIILSQIHFCYGCSKEGFMIYLDKMCLLAKSIFHDDKGFYYLEHGVYWICGNCGALNDLDNLVCYRCEE